MAMIVIEFRAALWTSAVCLHLDPINGYYLMMREQKPFPCLQAVIDDSASDKSDRRLFMAGFVSTAENWALFSDAWAAELLTRMPINYLKTSEANSRGGEFDGWTQAEVSEKLTRLKAVMDPWRLDEQMVS